jgi:hypothetical protein
MARVSVRNGLRLGALLAIGLAFAVTAVEATPRPRARRVLNLFSGFLGRQNVNRFDCGLNAIGMVCVDPNGSTTVGGGFWPKGTPDQYVFNSGLQLAGIVEASNAPPGFSWAGDTVGAFWFDPKGTTEHGDRLSLVWNSLDGSDNANWPRDAYVPNDTSLYNPVLIGLKAASQQDTWSRYWDGNPQNNAGRKHPLGILVDQRGMGWNFPTGNEDIIYYLYTFTNISASDPAVYAGRPDADSLVRYGTRFQALNEAAFAVTIPDTGYTITNMYAAFAMDADVSDAARENYSTAFLPFSMGTAFKRNWYAPAMLFPASVFSAPFAAAPGIVGVKYLKSPVVAGQEVGLTMFSNTINGGQFDDAQNTTQLWRYLSAKLDPSAGDAPCNEPSGLPPDSTHVCYISQSSDDIRFFQSSGPMSLRPGESKTIVVAYIAAAPVNTPAIAARGQALDLKPGWPAQPWRMGPLGTDTLRSVDRVFGALSIVGDTNGNGRIDQTEVRTVPRSLLNKGLVAQAVFNAKFLLPFPPAGPEFFLVPGNNQVTVVWKPSTTETDLIGDPYYKVASDSTSVLFDPNYRQRDVEGYRIYRGRTSGDLQLIAQFDYSGTQMVDFTATFDYGRCAPELGVTAGCPPGLSTVGAGHDLVGDVVQIPAGGRVTTLPDTSVVVLQADTAVTGGGAEGQCRPERCPALSNTGVPFAFTDHGVKNSFTYFYAVTAFDLNSVTSVGVGNTALESPRAPKTVTPRKSSGQQTAGALGTLELVGGDGSVLTGAMPTLDAATGIFSGPMPPANGIDLGLAAFLPEVLPNGSVEIRIDSIIPGTGTVDYFDVQTAYHFTVLSLASPVRGSGAIQTNCCDEEVQSAAANFPAAPAATSKAARFGGDSTFTLQGSVKFRTPGAWRNTSWGRGAANALPENSERNGPRWWTGTPNETLADPNGLVCIPAAGTCVQGNLARNSGALAGVTTIFNPRSYETVTRFPMRDLETALSTVSRAADIRLYWGASGAVDSVVDVTHRVRVPYSPKIRASWGFLNDSSFVGVPAAQTVDGDNALLTWKDIFCVDPSPAYVTDYCQGATTATLMNHARSTPISAVADSFDTGASSPATTPATGNGFILYLNGHFFVMQLAAGLPAAGTVWNARFYSGVITGAPGSFVFTPEVRPAAVPGLRARVTFQGSTFDPTVTSAAKLDSVHTVPDPYYVTNALEQSPNAKKLRFVNLPSQSIVRIYTLSGILVQVLTLNDATSGGELEWNLRNRNNQFVASGVYFYHVEAPDGKTKVGRFTVVNFAQ